MFRLVSRFDSFVTTLIWVRLYWAVRDNVPFDQCSMTVRHRSWWNHTRSFPNLVPWGDLMKCSTHTTRHVAISPELVSNVESISIISEDEIRFRLTKNILSAFHIHTYFHRMSICVIPPETECVNVWTFWRLPLSANCDVHFWHISAPLSERRGKRRKQWMSEWKEKIKEYR